MQVDPNYPAPPTTLPPSVPSSGTPDGNKSYTILRIKRKRNEEPLDALVVESRIRRKKSRGGAGVFQYAETVENDAWNDEARQKDIQEKISQLARETAKKQESQVSLPTADEVPPSPSSRAPKEENARRYTIVEREEVKQPPRRYPTAPPKVLSAKELEKNQSSVDFKMYDAIPAAEEPSMEVDQSSEMDKFLPMLNDYLRIHNNDTNTTGPSMKPSGSSDVKIVSSPSVDDDYVWDVFYHRPATLSEWNEVSNVGTVTGLPPSFGDGYDSASDSEEEFDEADEDSNAEEYYKNDYPEDEDDSESSDEFHESSDYDEMMEYHNPREQFDE